MSTRSFAPSPFARSSRPSANKTLYRRFGFTAWPADSTIPSELTITPLKTIPPSLMATDAGTTFSTAVMIWD